MTEIKNFKFKSLFPYFIAIPVESFTVDGTNYKEFMHNKK